MNIRMSVATALFAVLSFAYVACHARSPIEDLTPTSIYQGAIT